MRKLIAAAAVLAVVALAICGCGGSADQSVTVSIQPGGSFHVAGATQPTLKRPVNVAMFYIPMPGLRSPLTEVYVFDGKFWVRSTAASFITEADSVRIKHDPSAKVVESRLTYMNAKGVMPGHKYPKLNNEGRAPLAKPITANNGEIHRLRLKEIAVWVYDPRFPHSTDMDE